MLGTPDAYLLPPFPGVGYLSVDTDIYQRFKTALVTTPHDDGSADRDAADRPRSTPRRARSADARVARARRGRRATELDVIVGRVRDEHGAAGPVHQVWLAPLPGRLPLSAGAARPVVVGARRTPRAGAGGPRACLGLLDRALRSAPGPARRSTCAGIGGHLAVVGAPQTGQEHAAAHGAARLLCAQLPGRGAGLRAGLRRRSAARAGGARPTSAASAASPTPSGCRRPSARSARCWTSARPASASTASTRWPTPASGAAWVTSARRSARTCSS